ncbi:Crp/Fnr family transcriptional regulator, partial [Listeria monocytogenes]|nr:Crp/Fnr family transcriptional regulator [Listeria monocytogenes]
MEKLFTYKEFVDMMRKYGIRHTKRKLRRGENLMENASKFS